jgi:poly-gamma-glutamate system protein
LNIAALAAIHVLQLEPVIISSVGASTYGANEPSWTWLDMESILREKGIFPYRSQAASLGGLAKTQGGLGGQGIDMAREAIRRNKIPYLDEEGEESLPEDLARRLALYEKNLGGKRLSVFVNVGGSLTSLGDCPEGRKLPVGLLRYVPISDHPRRGIIFRMKEKGVPVIHLLNINKIAVRYGLAIDPFPLPPIPSGRVMHPGAYIRSFALSGTILLFLLALWLRESRFPIRFGNTRRQ